MRVVVSKWSLCVCGCVACGGAGCQAAYGLASVEVHQQLGEDLLRADAVLRREGNCGMLMLLSDSSTLHSRACGRGGGGKRSVASCSGSQSCAVAADRPAEAALVHSAPARRRTSLGVGRNP